MTLVWRPGWNGLTEPEAVEYVAAVEAADGQDLEFGVAKAINDFVLGCKNDGIWSAIKASCILAGARTLNGALVPLVGSAPTSFNFVAGDYNRETGLAGDGSTKYLNSNRAGNADPQDSFHAVVYRSDSANLGTSSFMGSQQGDSDRNGTFYTFGTSTGYAARKNVSGDPLVASSHTTTGLIGIARLTSTDHRHRIGGTTYVQSISSIPPDSTSFYIFANNNNNTLTTPTAARLAFYSIGESLDLEALDTRVTDLMTAIGAAIP